MLIGCVLCASRSSQHADLIAVEEGAFIVGSIFVKKYSLFYCSRTYCILITLLYIFRFLMEELVYEK